MEGGGEHITHIERRGKGMAFGAAFSAPFASISPHPSSRRRPYPNPKLSSSLPPPPRSPPFRRSISASPCLGVSAAEPVAQFGSEKLREICRSCGKWTWRGHGINYLVKGSSGGPPVLLVHGFGASIAHWRRNIGVLAENYTVYAIDLIGFGASDKPLGFSYTMEVWAQLILDFLDEVVKEPTVLIGNSVGSLACVIAASESTKGLVRGIVLLNCAGGMNNKAIVDDWRIKLLLPLLWFFDFLLKQHGIASALFQRVKDRTSSRREQLVADMRRGCLSPGLDVICCSMSGGSCL